MNFTIFEAPKDENATITFNNIITEDLYQAFQLFARFDVLNIPLKNEGVVKGTRTSPNLAACSATKIDYIIINAECKNQENFNKVISYFKERNLKTIIGASKKFDGITNFDFKGILKTQECPINQVSMFHKFLENDLKGYCELHKQFYRTGNFTYRIYQSNVLYANLDGEPFSVGNSKLSDLRMKIDIDSSLKLTKESSIVDFCKEAFKIYGFVLEEVGQDGRPDIYKKEFIDDSGQTDYEYGYYYYENSPYIMFHEKYYKSCDIFNSVKKHEMKLVDFEGKLDYDATTIPETFLNNDLKIIDKKIKKFIASKGNNFITLKGAMGSGKSKILRRIIDAIIEEGLKILIVTNRVSLADEFEELYKIPSYKYQRDIIKYKSEINNLKSELKPNSNKNYQINLKIEELKSKIKTIANSKKCLETKLGNRAKSLICQFDSLKNYNKDDFDVLLVDECVSTLFYSRNFNDCQNINDYKENLKIFYSCLLEKKVILSDAFLNKYFIDIFKKKTNFIFNLKSDAKDSSSITSCETRPSFYKLLSRAILRGFKVTVSCISDSELTFMQNFLKILKPNIKIMTFTMKTSDAEKNHIFNCIKQDRAPYDVLIYSPSLTAGVSIVNKDIEHHFHFDCSSAIDPVSSIQMLRRNRIAKYFYYYVKNLELPLCNDEQTLILRACNPGGLKYGVKSSSQPNENLELSNVMEVQKNHQNRVLRPRIYTYAGIDKKNPKMNRLSKEGELQIKIDKFLNTICINQKVSFECFLELNFSNKPKRFSEDFELNKFKKAYCDLNSIKSI